jgi:hypothetical protein
MARLSDKSRPPKLPHATNPLPTPDLILLNGKVFTADPTCK